MNLDELKTHKFINPIFLNGLIGDVLAVESFMSKAQKDKVDCIYYLGINPKVPETVEQLCKIAFPNLIKFQTFWSDEHSYKHRREHKDIVRRKILSITNCADFSIQEVVSDYSLTKYCGSSFLDNTIADLNFDLPFKFAFVHPHSKSNSFTKREWKQCICYLNREKLKGVVINDVELSLNNCLINLTGKTTFLQAIEILKRSDAFLGVSSSFAVLATKIIPPTKIKIRADSVFRSASRFVYYAPNTTFPFLFDASFDLGCVDTVSFL